YFQNRFPEGTQTFVTSEVRRLAERGHRVLVVSSRHSTIPPPPGVEVITIEDIGLMRIIGAHLRALSSPRHYGRYLRAVWHFGIAAMPWSLWLPVIRECTERRQVTHVHTHFATRAAACAGVYARWVNLPRSVTTHAADIYQHNAALEKQLEAATIMPVT